MWGELVLLNRGLPILAEPRVEGRISAEDMEQEQPARDMLGLEKFIRTFLALMSSRICS